MQLANGKCSESGCYAIITVINSRGQQKSNLLTEDRLLQFSSVFSGYLCWWPGSSISCLQPATGRLAISRRWAAAALAAPWPSCRCGWAREADSPASSAPDAVSSQARRHASGAAPPAPAAAVARLKHTHSTTQAEPAVRGNEMKDRPAGEGGCGWSSAYLMTSRDEATDDGSSPPEPTRARAQRMD